MTRQADNPPPVPASSCQPESRRELSVLNRVASSDGAPDLVSVIVPAWNAERTLERAVRSIQQQTYQNLEIIVVDDGSTDATWALAQRLQTADTRIKTIHRTMNGGVSAARNEALRAARGDFIYLVDSDDSVAAAAIETMLRLLRENDGDIVALSKFRVLPSRGVDGAVVSSQQALDALARLDFPTSVWACMFTSQVVDGLRFNERLHLFEDAFYVASALKRCRRVVMTDLPLYEYSPVKTGANGMPFGPAWLSALDAYNELRKLDTRQSYVDSLAVFGAHLLRSFVGRIARGNVAREVGPEEFRRVTRLSRSLVRQGAISNANLVCQKKALILLCSVDARLVRGALIRIIRWSATGMYGVSSPCPRM